MNRQLKAYWKVALVCLCAFWVSIDIPCQAQQQEPGGKSASNITSPPDNQVLDQANVFLEHPEVLAEMVGRLSRMKDVLAFQALGNRSLRNVTFGTTPRE